MKPEGLVRIIKTLPLGEYEIIEAKEVYPRTHRRRWGVAIHQPDGSVELRPDPAP